MKVVVDLSGKKAGKYQKKYQVRGIDSGINYQIKPEVAHINLENKITRVMHVQPDISSNSFCLLYTSPSPRDGLLSRMPSSA